MLWFNEAERRYQRERGSWLQFAEKRQRSVRGGSRRWVCEFTVFLKCRLPALETGPPDTEVPAGKADMPGLLGMPKDPQPALDLAIFLGHRRHPSRPIGLRNGISRKIVDIYNVLRAELAWDSSHDVSGCKIAPEGSFWSTRICDKPQASRLPRLMEKASSIAKTGFTLVPTSL